MRTLWNLYLEGKSYQNDNFWLEDYSRNILKKGKLTQDKLVLLSNLLSPKIKISEYPAVDTGELLNSMKAEAGDVIQAGSKWIVFTDCPHAAYVEFGTGIVGERDPHPDTSLVGWRYDINEHGEAGWHYYKNGEWHWTKGMQSRPFMYETGRDLRMKVSKIAKEVFADD